METILLDCARMTDRETAHDYLAQALNFPEWYGRNLDALYDLLTGWLGPARLEVVNVQALEELGGYGRALLSTIQEAADEAPGLELVIREE
ncbi:MAG: barstar family protein [Lawsonibacter sp.]|nr:barstar family protein [Lawsonibacter sp.]